MKISSEICWKFIIEHPCQILINIFCVFIESTLWYSYSAAKLLAIFKHTCLVIRRIYGLPLYYWKNFTRFFTLIEKTTIDITCCSWINKLLEILKDKHSFLLNWTILLSVIQEIAMIEGFKMLLASFSFSPKDL